MCTVTFLPRDASSFILTSNRDEMTARPSATPPVIKKYSNYKVMYPQDPLGGGSWIASDDRNNAICLLNGAFQRHKPQYPYRHSRGLVVLDFFKFDHLCDFVDFYDLNNIEPFTLVIIHDFQLYEFRWDGLQKFLRNFSFEHPKVWSSVTLYDAETVIKREKWFAEWLNKETYFTLDRILEFHLFGGEGKKEIDVLMEREDHIKTVSITSILNQNNITTMHYRDILRNEEYSASVTFNKEN